MQKVFGIGWAKTGTTTLGQCFQILGYQHQSQNLSLVKDIARQDLADIFNLAHRKESFEDWPWLLLYKELDAAFPGSKFVLTTRNPIKWFKSYQNMLFQQGDATPELNEIRRILYGLPFPDVSGMQLIARYQRHNREVLDYFRARPNDLLVVDWENDSRWNSLCQFLGRPIPDEPFPHANKGRYGSRSLLDRLSGAIGRFVG